MARVLTLLLALALGGSHAHASCLDDAIRVTDAEVLARDAFFVLPGGVRSGVTVLDQARCITVLATATNPNASVDAVLRSESGLDLAADGPTTPHASVRFCGAAGVTLHWSLSVSAPTEVQVAVLDRVPSPLPDLGRELGGCFAGAPGLRSPDPELGAPPPAMDAQARVDELVVRLQERGYALERRTTVAIADERGEQSLVLEGGRCYAVWAVPEIGALDLSLMGPNGDELAADRRRAVDGGLAYCPDMSGELTLVVHDGGGVEQATVVVLGQPADAPAALRGPGVRAWVETEARYGDLEVDAWMHLRTGEGLEIPTELSGCGVHAAVPAHEAWGGRVELQLIDAQGGLLATARSTRGAAVLRHCGVGPHTFRVRMLRGAGRVLLGGRGDASHRGVAHAADAADAADASDASDASDDADAPDEGDRR